MNLFYREFGGKGQPLIILHGLFGSSDNWLTQAKMLADRFHVYVPDQRNHGQSPHHDQFDLNRLADDIHEFLITNTINDPVIMGHSMGGKAAMKFATANPELLSRLIVVDIAPRAQVLRHDRILEGFRAIPVSTIQSRNEADEILARYVADKGERQFLLKNLQRNPDGGFSWKINLPVLERDAAKIGEAIPADKKFEKPTLFIRGSRSDYVRDEDIEQISAIFPQAGVVTLDAGHWVQAEKPRELVDEVIKFVG